MPRLPVHLSQQAKRTADSPITWFIQQAVENPRFVSLAAGLVDPVTLPAAEVAEAVAYLMARPALAQAALQYGTTQGHGPLREQLLTRIGARDRAAPADLSLNAHDIVLTTGSQQLLYFLGELLVDPGDIIITEAPTYFVCRETFHSAGARVRTVPVDEHGLNVDALEEMLVQMEQSGELEQLRFIYVVDYFQNPTGLSLSAERRPKLVELARRFSRQHRILIIEDAAYRELRYDGPDLPSLKSYDTDNTHVVLAMTFSKPCAPGLKTGYGVLPTDLVGPLLHLKGVHDFGSNNLTLHILTRLMESGAYDQITARLCDTYRTKRDALLTALAAEFAGLPPALTPRWTRPDGGLYIWMTCPESVTTGHGSPFMDAALREGVLYVPGEFCFLDSDEPAPTNQLRLSFGVVTPAQLQEGARRLGRAYRSAVGMAGALAGAR